MRAWADDAGYAPTVPGEAVLFVHPQRLQDNFHRPPPHRPVNRGQARGQLDRDRAHPGRRQIATSSRPGTQAGDHGRGGRRSQRSMAVQSGADDRGGRDRLRSALCAPAAPPEERPAAPVLDLDQVTLSRPPPRSCGRRTVYDRGNQAVHARHHGRQVQQDRVESSSASRSTGETGRRNAHATDTASRSLTSSSALRSANSRSPPAAAPEGVGSNQRAAVSSRAG